jgi:hypothetical protein
VIRRPTFTFGSAAALLIGISLSACSSGLSGTSPSAVATATASELPGSVTSSGSPEESLGPFTCAFPIHGAATVANTQITDLAVGAHDTYDRIVFDFASGSPEYTIEKASPPLVGDPNGLPIEVQGSSFLRIILHGASAAGYGGTPFNGPTSFTPRFAKLVDLKAAGDFEAVATWYAGMNGDACVRAFTLTAPSRLVIDLQH